LSRHLATVAGALLIAGCASSRPVTSPSAAGAGLPAATGALVTELDAGYSRHRVPGLSHRRFSPAEYWDLLLPIVHASEGRLRVRQIGESIEGRPLRRVDFGHGDVVVLAWSQMHGNESTASRALVDVSHFLATRPNDPLVQRLDSNLHIVFVPLVNPDGASRFVRHNAIGVDINRDARRLATPEARALKQVRDETDAVWGFNLHDQNVRTRLGDSGRDVLISLLAPPPGPGQTSPANQAARRVCSLLADALEPIVNDQVARYDESFNPRAFGDLMTRWGTSVVLIESGGEMADPNKDRLRRANYLGLLAALDAIATGAWKNADPQRYLDLPLNSPWVYDLIVREASIVLPGRAPVRADFAIDFDDTLARAGGKIVEVGDLDDAKSLQQIEAAGLFFLPDPESLDSAALAIGAPATGVLARHADGSDPVLRLQDGNAVSDR